MRIALSSMALCLLVLAGCQTRDRRMPTQPGLSMEISLAPRHEPADESALQIRWFGTSCYTLQVGDLSVLIDPFVSNGYAFPPDFGSNDEEVKRVLAPLKPEPRAIFVNHTHNDHFLDAHRALELWPEATLYGSKTAKNILAGFKLQDRATDVGVSPEQTIPEQGTPGGYFVRYTAFKSRHTAHIKCGELEVTLLAGKVEQELEAPPRFLDYKAGEVYNYLFEFKKADQRLINVFLLGSPYSMEMPLPPEGTPIDVLIILVPSAENVEGDYPNDWIRRLKPRQVVLSHFNNFMAKRGDRGAQKTLFAADVGTFLQEVQEDALDLGLERIYVPSIADPSSAATDTVIRIPLKVE